MAHDLAQRFVKRILDITALTANLTLATRNIRDFAPLGIALVDPWAPLASPESTDAELAR